MTHVSRPISARPPRLLHLILMTLITPSFAHPSPGLPLVINTWGGPFTAATDTAYLALTQHPSNTSALDAVEIGCSTCERNQCDGTVGFGGSPDENCETTLDALIIDGTTLKSGAVAGLRRVRDAISVARHVLEHTTHSLLVGDLATRFAVENGFAEEDLGTEGSRERCRVWREGGCQANYRVNVRPDPRASCGPYVPVGRGEIGELGGMGIGMVGEKVEHETEEEEGPKGHDTISMVVIHQSGVMAAGTSTNGASHKVPGRVGDGPIVGSGSYVDGDVGGCGATGDGDIMMRFLPCYQAVENLRQGMEPQEAAEDAVRRMLRKYPKMSSGIVVVNNKGEFGAAASGWTFTYAVRGGKMDAHQVFSVPPLVADSGEDEPGFL